VIESVEEGGVASGLVGAGRRQRGEEMDGALPGQGIEIECEERDLGIERGSLGGDDHN
jgi:hypothetical protein